MNNSIFLTRISFHLQFKKNIQHLVVIVKLEIQFQFINLEIQIYEKKYIQICIFYIYYNKQRFIKNKIIVLIINKKNKQTNKRILIIL